MSRALALAAAIVLLAAANPAAAPGKIRGTLTIKKGGKAKASCAGAVVYLRSVPGEAPAPRKPKPIRQQNRKFIPSLSVVVKGTRVEFPNEDKFNHSVYSRSSPARDLDLAEYDRAQVPSYTFERVGEVELACKIHPAMNAKVYVVPNGWYAEVADDCSFAIDAVPPGSWPITVWLDGATEVTRTVTVEAGKTAALALEIQEGEKPTAPLRQGAKGRTPYRRGY